MISSKFRFHGHGSLRYVYSHGEAVRSPQATIKWVKNDRRHNSRVSIVVSKKVIKKAIGRNRIRRRLYEYMRQTIPKLDSTYDIVVIVTTPDFRVMSFLELEGIIDELLTKAGLLKTSEN